MANTNNIDNIINEIDEQKHIFRLKKVIDDNNHLIETIINETSKEHIEKLNEITSQKKEQLEKVINAINKDFNKKISLENIVDDLENFRKSVNDIEKKIKKLEKKKNRTNDEDNKLDSLKNKLKDEKKGLILLENSMLSYYNAANSEQKELNKRQLEGITILDDYSEKWEQKTRALRKGTKEVADGAKSIYTAIKETLKPWAQSNDEAMKYARSMGMSQKTADLYLSKTVSWAADNNIGLLFNKTTDELIKMQGKYSEVLGRNIQLTDEQKKDMLAMENFLGEDGMMDIANNLENLGMGMSDSAEFVKKQLDSATKSGIVASKLTKTIRENIKMAQNYTFKNGLDGLASMAKKAIELKTDMSLVEGFANNVSTLEGSITTGANLQVLGGSYAMGADPLSMMYESLNDMEGLFDRAVGMAKGKVFYNDQTGNFEMGAMDRYIMKQAATTMGIDPSKLIDSAFRQASLGRIEDQVRLNSNISGDKEMIDLVKNLATWNNGEAVVNIGGENKKVSELGIEDKERLEAMQRTDSQNLQEMAINLRSMNDIMSGTEKEINNEQANMTQGIAQKVDDLLGNSTKILDIVAKIGAFKNILGGVTGILGGVWTTARGVLRMGKGIGNLFDETPENISGATNKVTRGIKLNQVGGLFKKGGLRYNETIFKGENGQKYKQQNGKWQILQQNGKWKNTSHGNLPKSAGNLTQIQKKGGLTNLAKSVGKGMKTGVGIGALGSAISIGIDVATGEFQKDMGRSIGKATGSLVGSIVGGIFGPIGSMVGGYVGSVITEGIHNAQDRNRGKLRDKIAEEFSLAGDMILSGLFSGENALQGNYSKKQLNKLKHALEDKVLSEDEVNNPILRKARNNGDLIRLRNAGIEVKTELANGGMIRGISHSQGGMPILGTNIEVEGGEYVINKESTRKNLPLLNKINRGDFNMKPIKPLGDLLKVNNSINNSSLPNNSKIDIKPISINLSGTIKLESGNKQLDITNEILNNPQLISKLTEMINKQINILEYGSYNKNYIKQKFV